MTPIKGRWLPHVRIRHAVRGGGRASGAAIF